MAAAQRQHTAVRQRQRPAGGRGRAVLPRPGAGAGLRHDGGDEGVGVPTLAGPVRRLLLERHPAG